MNVVNEFNRVKKCRYGTMVYNVHDIYIGRSLDLYGEFSRGEVEMFGRILRPGDIVADIGANIGAHTIYFAQTVGPQGMVLAFEPQRIVYQTLCGNMSLNSITNAFCFNIALGEAPSSLIVPPLDYRKEKNFGGLSLGQYTQGELVEVRRFDIFDLPHCRMIKIDVEGMELQALKGCEGIIKKHQPILYVENDREQNSAALIHHISSLGYALFWHTPPLFNLDNFLGNRENVFGDIVSINMLCLPKNEAHMIADLEPVSKPRPSRR